MIVLLYQPEIPQNAGNIVRTCSAANAELILVRPLGFSTSNRMLKRAGLDYWEGVKVTEIDDHNSFLESYNGPVHFFSSKAKTLYTEVSYQENSLLIFGSETKGLPDIYWQRWQNSFVTIPMAEKARCLNLSNAVAIGLYEAIRQQQG